MDLNNNPAPRFPALEGLPEDVALEGQQIGEALRAFMLQHGFKSFEEVERVYEQQLAEAMVDEAQARVPGVAAIDERDL